jgi:hypothetical protein
VLTFCLDLDNGVDRALGRCLGVSKPLHALEGAVDTGEGASRMGTSSSLGLAWGAKADIDMRYLEVLSVRTCAL